MSSFSVKVQQRNRTGELRRQLRPRFAEVINETAEEMASVARQLVPVDSGDLRDSIAVESYAGGSSDLAKAIVAGMPYATFVEFGTSRSPAQPFMRPAFEFVKPRLYRRLGYVFRLNGAGGAQ